MTTICAPIGHGVSARSMTGLAHPKRCSHVSSHRITLQRSGIRLTRRGRGLLALVLALVMVALVVAGALRATAASTEVPTGWTTTVVQPGDTLWSLASSRAKGEDPRSLIAQIKTTNGLTGSGVVSGQRLLLPG
jgi:hypothetical protein